MTQTIDTPIALEAKDLLPETWDALADAKTFGPAALERRHNRVITRIWGVLLTDVEQEVLTDNLIEYAGKKLAYSLIDPGIDYWSSQILARTVGDRESSTFKDRAEHLKDMRKQWTTDLSEMYLDIEILLPPRVGRAMDAPRVVQAGLAIPHITANPDDIPPLYGPADGTVIG
jgi:hypothetical protein